MRIAGWVGRHRGVVDPRPGLQSGAVPQRRPRPFGISPGGGEVGPALCCRVCADGACDRAGLRWWSAGNRLPQDRLPTGPPADLATGRRMNLEAAQRSEEHTSELQSLMRHSYAVFFLTKNNKLNISKLH